MKVISSREFRDKQKMYFDMAANERIIVKRKNEYLEIVHRGDSIPENPSPSNDPYFNDPKNLDAIDRGIEDMKAGRVTRIDPDKDLWEQI